MRREDRFHVTMSPDKQGFDPPDIHYIVNDKEGEEWELDGR